MVREREVQQARVILWARDQVQQIRAPAQEPRARLAARLAERGGGLASGFPTGFLTHVFGSGGGGLGGLAAGVGFWQKVRAELCSELVQDLPGETAARDSV